MTTEQKWDLVKYRFENAKKTLGEVDVLIQNNLWNNAVNRLYYACFYAVNALLLLNDISTKTHAGSIKMFGLHFINTGIIQRTTGDFYSKIFTMRNKGDYEDYVDYSPEEVIALIQPSKDLISQIGKILFEQQQ
jgi:uncharacterized protein (UPF0332 family)